MMTILVMIIKTQLYCKVSIVNILINKMQILHNYKQLFPMGSLRQLINEWL